ncbi:glycosyltransferase [Kingella kingae]|uniref:glycosyltransferase n=1 Tax=Kingella kingae TaxID=504 RepID=UPI0002DE83F5|nr:glycosyltransferase [Kingella kingae]MDK4529447.1 glycosyltransferase [Kingella kingae]MDK4555182.1 glycosyltransferase [Kingella kingae]MDK4584245.1 glycosyltransferase [Kingella kingae]MDK4588240.1 glycosyltransferase [Kingella kingae]MDK4596362.1 glycosyltransferase [Kingella kingae]
MYALSVIIPFRCETESTEHLLLRLKDLCAELVQAKQERIEFMVVDSGSSPRYRQQCMAICQEYNIRYLYHDTLGKAFSIGACRDFGVQHAHGRAVSFLDVDLRVAPDFWDRLLNLMQAWGISKYKKSFLAIPCLYLTQEGTTEFIAAEPETKFTDFYLRYLQGDKQAIENLAFCSSVMIVERSHYLSVGGHDLAFRGHGYEDFELYHRLLCEEDIIPKSQDYYLDQKTWNTATYRGFRSHLAIAARPAMMMNLFVVHLWHPRPKDASFYSPKSLTENRTIWEDKFKQFVETGVHPEVLPTANNMNDNIVFFGKPQTHAAACIRNATPYLGKIVYVSEYDFMDVWGQFKEESFKQFLQSFDVKKILFPNPYGNPARLAIYHWCRENHIPFYCYERGALPDSWFFDPHGFNADSISYDTQFWDKPLDESSLQKVQDYIQHCIIGAPTLEKQDGRIGADALAQKLQLGGKKVLFVPMQRPSDTVIKHMAGNIRSFSKFADVVDKLAANLKSKGWVVLCKKHPLETEVPALKHAQYVPQDTNFLDLLELADRVVLINSGVGVYAMMMQKPCYIFGDAFYAIPEVNQSIKYLDFESDSDIEQVAQQILAGFEVNTEKMYRFVHYLTQTFYSFGTPKIIQRKEKDGSLRTITTGVDFYNLRIDGKLIFEYESQPRPKLNLSAPMFERYALDIHMQKKSVSSAAATTAPKTTPPAKTEAKPPVKAETKPVAKMEAKPTPKVDVKPSVVETPAKQPAQVEPVVQAKQALLDSVQQGKSKQEIRSAKWKKLMRDPQRFFADSKKPLVKNLARLFGESGKK